MILMETTKQVSPRVIWVFAGVIAVAVVVWIIFGLVRRPVPGGFIRIANLSDYTTRTQANREAIAQVESALYHRVNEFTSVRSDSVRDMLIRPESFEQIEQDRWHRASMIVDSDSLGMSFTFFFQWGNPTLFEAFDAVIFCVQPEDVIFPDFECVDPQNEGDDPILEQDINDLIRVLPITTPSFSIRGDILAEPAEIIITIRMTEEEQAQGMGEVHFKRALDLLRERGLNLDNYNITRTQDTIISLPPVQGNQPEV